MPRIKYRRNPPKSAKSANAMKVHFIGIGGIGVSALAQYYLKTGHQVSGSDLVFSEVTDFLKKQGAKILIGPHNPKSISKDIDLVIYSPAVQEFNPELKEAEKLGIKCLSYPEALGELTKKYFTIAISGTHGKSTTTAMIAKILIKADFDPTVIIGTKLKEFCNSNFRMGSDKIARSRQFVINFPILIIEADEYAGSFLNYWPKIIVLTNIEKDHLDYYKNLGNILKAFKKYIGHLSKDGWLVVNADDRNSSKLKTQISKLQLKTKNYSLKQGEVKKLKKILKVPGEHNVYNALAALAVARILKIPDKISFEALSKYKGAWRRFEEKTIKLKTKNYKLISDYAHHPTEIMATLRAAREKFPTGKIWCIYQPHQYQRTFYLFDDFVKVLRQAQDKFLIDKLIIVDIYDVAGREKKKIKKIVSSKKLAEKIRAKYIPGIEDAEKYLRKNLKGGEVVIVMGAGDIYKLVNQLID